MDRKPGRKLPERRTVKDPPTNKYTYEPGSDLPHRRTVEDPPTTIYRNPMAVLPTATIPLRVLEGHPDFPVEYIEDRPRLIDISSPRAFGSNTDCTKLRMMDAVVTILWAYDPELLKRFFAPPYGDNCDV